MDSDRFSRLDLSQIDTPSFVVDIFLLEENLKVLKSVKDATGCKILLALKGFAMFSVFPLVSRYLDGICASGLIEAQLGREEFGREVHTFAPAFKDSEFAQVNELSDHVVFNSLTQWEKFKGQVSSGTECCLRINPEYSEVEVALYDPCGENSRLGITADKLMGADLSGISGLHFHAMCEQNSDTLERIVEKVEKKFAPYLKEVSWVNFGGGHHITRSDYDVDLLCRIINDFKAKYDVQVYLEPGEAVALNTGVLVTQVLDIIDNGKKIAILDTSAETHMPDVLAMPYRPEIIGAGRPDELEHTYRLGGVTCLAGDIIGDYSFNEALKIGDKLVFLDMAHYSMVKTTTFNGIKLPSIWKCNSESGELIKIKDFGYEDYKSRLS